MAIVAEGERGRVYLAPTPEHGSSCAAKREPEWKPGRRDVHEHPRDFKTPIYGLTKFERPLHPSPARGADDLLRPGAGSARAGEARRARRGPARRRQASRDGGTGATAYADAVAVYLAFAVDQAARSQLHRLCDLEAMQRADSRNTFRAASASDGLGLCRGESLRDCWQATSSDGIDWIVEAICTATSWPSRVCASRLTQRAVQSLSWQGRLHRSALLRQHRLRRSVGLLLRLAAPLAEARVPGPLRYARRAEGRGAGRHALPPRQQGEGGGVLPRRHDAGDAPPRRAGAPGLPGHHLLRLQAGGERWRRRHRQHRLGDVPRRGDSRWLRHQRHVADADRAAATA